MTWPKPRINKTMRTILWMLLDAVLANCAMMMAQQFRLGAEVHEEFFSRYLNIIPELIVFCWLAFWAFGIYRNLWQYASPASVVQIVLASLVGVGALYGYGLIRSAITYPENYHLLHRTIYLLYWMLLIALTGGARLIFRMLVTRNRMLRQKGTGEHARRAMIVGAGWAGANVIREMQNGRYGRCTPILAVDDDEQRKGAKIYGVPVLCGTGNILRLASEYSIDEIIIAIATPKGDIRALVEKCLSTGCHVRRATSLEEVGADHRTVGAVRELNINDLLGRPEKQLDTDEMARFFCGQVVLITGGGGSIGSELCRQLLALSPQKLVLYDVSENYMYDLFFELQEQCGRSLKDQLILTVGSIRDEQRLHEVMDLYRPDIVVHAAAHKHVPLMEDCPSQAVKNNVFGTYYTAKAAMANGVKRFVMISTDKAVNPTNIMGASKRLAEIVVEALNGEGKTEFTAVRFGNVLGSHGSVVPLFERQIRMGGPITLTHPEIIRYFMTIPEAAGLVLKAASMAQGGELFVLDMGQPVKIRELAERMIQLYAPQNGKQVEIEYVGLRPGEKLYEELLTEGEGLTRTQTEKIFVAHPDSISLREMEQMLKTLQACIDERSDMRACMHGLLPDFREADQVNERAEEEHRLEAAQAGA